MAKLYARLGEDLARLLLLTVAVLLEAAAVLSIVLQTAFLPIGAAYPNVISVAVYLMPTVVGFLARRFEAAIILAVLPFWLLTLGYLAAYAPVYNVDLVQLGVLTGRVGGSTFLLGCLGLLGWLLRRAIFSVKATRLKVD